MAKITLLNSICPISNLIKSLPCISKYCSPNCYPTTLLLLWKHPHNHCIVFQIRIWSCWRNLCFSFQYGSLSLLIILPKHKAANSLSLMISAILFLLYQILFSKSKNLRKTILSFSVNKLCDQLTIVLSFSINYLVSCQARFRLFYRSIPCSLVSISCIELYQSFRNY